MFFSGCTVLLDSKETKLGSSDEEASPSAGKNVGDILVPCTHRSVSLQLFLVVCILLRSLCVICYNIRSQ